LTIRPAFLLHIVVFVEFSNALLSFWRIPRSWILLHLYSASTSESPVTVQYSCYDFKASTQSLYADESCHWRIHILCGCGFQPLDPILSL